MLLQLLKLPLNIQETQIPSNLLMQLILVIIIMAHHDILHGIDHLSHKMLLVFEVNGVILNENLPESQQSHGIIENIVIFTENFKSPPNPLRFSFLRFLPLLLLLLWLLGWVRSGLLNLSLRFLLLKTGARGYLRRLLLLLLLGVFPVLFG